MITVPATVHVAAEPKQWDAGTPDILTPAARNEIAAAIASLNAEQRQAVEALDGPVLVVAGAGTGKTKVLTTRIANLIATGKAFPDQILAVTFTNKASAEMRQRVALLIGDTARGLVMGSFHAVSLMILRAHARAAGLANERFAIFDEDDQLIMIETAMARLGFEDGQTSSRQRSDAWKTQARQLLAQIQSWKEDAYAIEDAEEAAGQSNDTVFNRLVAVYRAYQDELATRNAVDFADIILHPVRLFRADPAIRGHWSSLFRYILVDEFQDTSGLQYEWLNHLARPHRNIFAVGDGDQCIYQWRNARPETFAGFAADWTGTREIVLTENYRSTQAILDLANGVVNATSRPGAAPRKALRSKRPGEPVRLKAFDTHIDEAAYVAEDIERRIAFGTVPGEIAVLFRAARQMLAFEQALVSRAIPYRIVCGYSFAKREEVKDVMAYLRLALNPGDELALMRIINRPWRGIDENVKGRVLSLMRSAKLAASTAAMAASQEPMSAITRGGLESLARVLSVLSNKAAIRARPHEFISTMLEQTGYAAWLKSTDAPDDLDEILDELVVAAKDFKGEIEDFMQGFTLMAAGDDSNPIAQVRLSTIHAAKGLEFDVVYTPCLEEGVLPNLRSVEESYGLAEERRVLHVAWTRPRQVLIPSCARMRHHEAALPSRFLEESGLVEDEHRDILPMTKKRGNQGPLRVKRMSWGKKAG